ncbi:hypothetical protein DFH09DRAFT_1372887 [Mycena vulgaris]|nr:hypothetical protein DFH09DRAFT_1372887 [Mycena vulgaris]
MKISASSVLQGHQRQTYTDEHRFCQWHSDESTLTEVIQCHHGPPNQRIAIVDFSPFLDGSNKQEVADKILASFKEIGLNHGIVPERVTKMFALSKGFFAQPMGIKMLTPHPPSGTHHRGYSAPGQYKISHHVYDAGAIAQHREQAPELRLCHAVRLDIMRALAVGFDLPEDYFLKVHTAPDNLLRLLHYPSVPVEALHTDRIARIGEHSDFGSITLLLQDDVGGVEVEDLRVPGSFRPGPSVPGALIVNAGAFMMRSRSSAFAPPPGPVQIDGMTPERYSIPYFCCADFSTVVDCIPGTWDADRPKKYEPISAQEYIMERMAASGDVLNDFDSIATCDAAFMNVYCGGQAFSTPASRAIR